MDEDDVYPYPDPYLEDFDEADLDIEDILKALDYAASRYE